MTNTEKNLQQSNFPIKPIKSRIVVSMIEKETVTAGGIILTKADREEANRAKVLAIGPDVEYVKVGDTILPDWNTAQKFKLEEQYYFVEEDNVVMIFE